MSNANPLRMLRRGSHKKEEDSGDEEHGEGHETTALLGEQKKKSASLKHVKIAKALIRESKSRGVVLDSMLRVRSTTSWDVKMPPIKKHIVAGYMVPTMRPSRLFVQRKRRVTVQVCEPIEEKDSDGSNIGTADDTTRESFSLGNRDVVLLRIRKERRDHGDHDDDDESVTSSYNMDDGASLVEISDLGGAHGVDEQDEDDGRFVEHKCYRLEEVVVLKQHTRTVEVGLGMGVAAVVRDLKFDAETDAQSFVTLVERMKELEKTRAHRLVEDYQKSRASTEQGATTGAGSGDNTMRAIAEEGEDGKDAMINILVEIVSATDLPVADIFSTDAFVVVRMGGKEIHRTGVINHTLDPVWAIDSDSLFLIQKTPEDFFAATGGVTFIVKDYDSLGSDDLLGDVNVHLDDLLCGKGERKEYEITPINKKQKKMKESTKVPKLFLRFKEASAEDIEFLQIYTQQKGKRGVYTNETYNPPRPPDMKFLKRLTKRDSEGQLIHRVKPFPNPSDEERTTWLTGKQIDNESKEPSTSWLEAGSGDVGCVYVEILSCDNLPNMDATNLNIRSKTDAFCTLVFEDAVVNTDVIGDSLSPRWMPWCRRAFCFRVSHPQSDLRIGVFDYDPPLGPMQVVSRAVDTVHDPIGRIVVRLSHFQMGTMYTLTYPMYNGDLAEDRENSRGAITIRLRLDWYNRRKTLINSILPPPPSYVSCGKKIEWQLTNYTVEGKRDSGEFSMSTFTRYIEELEAYQDVLPYLMEAALILWLWRGHFKVTIRGKDYHLPLHSMTAFAWGLLICYNFNFLPSFFVFSIGWIFLATNEFARKHPSPWKKARTYTDMLAMILFNAKPWERIAPNQNHAAIEAYDEARERERMRKEKEKEMVAKNEERLKKELGEEIEEATAADVDISTKKGGLLDWNVNPLKPVLYPIQLQLRDLVVYLRIFKNVILWEETFFSAWITSLSLLASIAIIWIPWGIVIRWVVRILIIVLLGPWMALVDRYYMRTKPDMTEAEVEAEIQKKLEARYDSVLQAAAQTQVKRERAIKLKKMSQYLYGRYLVNVPRFTVDLYPDIPLPQSFATPFDPDHAEQLNITERKFGQSLKGDMIPVREIQSGSVEVTRDKVPATRRLRALWSRANKTPGETAPLLGFGILKKFHKGYKAVEEKVEGASEGAETAAHGAKKIGGEAKKKIGGETTNKHLTVSQNEENSSKIK